MRPLDFNYSQKFARPGPKTCHTWKLRSVRPWKKIWEVWNPGPQNLLLNIKQEFYSMFSRVDVEQFFSDGNLYFQKRSLARRRRQNFLNPTWKKPNLWVIQAKNPTFQDFPGFHRCVSCNKPQFSRICKKKVALSRIFQDSRIFQEAGNPGIDSEL